MRNRPFRATAAAIVFLGACAPLLLSQLPGSSTRITVSALGTCRAGLTGRVVVIRDGLTTSDCTTGGATGDAARVVECICDQDGLGAFAWRVNGGEGGGGGAPSGPAGGDLAGTYPNPTIAANAVALGTDTTGGYAASTTEAGPATTATALAANGANCSAGSFPLGVDASGASETCTALPTTITGTANQITASSATGTVTLSIPTSPTLPGTTTGTFSGALTGNASTATALAANGTNCSAGQAAAGVDASGVAEGCAAYIAPGGASIVNADVSTSAAIALSKLAASTASRCARFDASGVLVPASADCASGDTGAAPAGVGSELQFRSSGSAFGALTSSSVSGADLTLGGLLNVGNLRLTGTTNTLSSTDTNGNINLTPNGSGNVTSGRVFLSTVGAQAFAAGSSVSNYVIAVNSGGGGTFELRQNGILGATGTTNANDSKDVSLSRVAAGVWGIGTGSAGSTAGWTQWGGSCVVATDQTNATATMQTSACFHTTTGSVAVAVKSGRTYSFTCELFLSDDVAADGAAIDFDGGTATATTFRAQVKALDSTLQTSSQVTALATDVSAATFTGAGAFEARGVLKPSADGTFQPRFAQASHSTGTLTLAAGSNCMLWDVTP